MKNNYYNNSAMSQSKMKILLENPRLFYLNFILGKELEKKSTAMNFGACLDLALTNFGEYQKLKVKDSKTTSVSGFITNEWKIKIDLMIEELNNYIFIDDFFNEISFKNIIKTCNKQSELYYKYNEIDWKMKPDFINVRQNFIIDLKSTKATSYDEYIKDFVKYGYYIQAGSYANGMQIYFNKQQLPRVYYIAISTVTNEIYTIQCSNRMLELGMLEIDRGCKIYKENLISNEWAINKAVTTLDLPEWKENQIVNKNSQLNLQF